MTQKRDQWGSKAGFILAAIGSAVGLGNIWRYPYVLYSNGGGAFLIPYFFAILTAGIPLMIMEYGLGHKFKGSPPLAFARANKRWEWLGWWPSINSFIILTYYTLILSWAINYLYFSITQAWGDDTNSFFFKDFLKMTDSPFKLGGFVWPVFSGITIIWLLNWFVCYKGVSGGIEKLNKILLPTLVVAMIIIVIRGVTLPGASLGLNKLFSPDWSKVLDPKVWIAAYGQVFFSLSLAMGIMITYSSYLPKKTDINNSAFMTAFANSGFEFLSAIGVFAILGYMASTQGVGVDKVASQGIGLAFIAFPKVFTVMGGIGKLFGVLFFICLVFAGITSSISLVEASSSALIDKTGAGRKKVVSLVCLVGYSISIVYSTGAGLYFLDIIDNFINSYGIVTVGLLEAITIGWLFGASKIREHTNAISYFSIGKWWNVMVKFITPLILTFMIISNIVNEIIKPYGGYSQKALIAFGWSVVILGIVLSLILCTRPWKDRNITSYKSEEVK
ncbi:sodium-dependent transporter [Ruminiclostridium cellulolyticum]|uniref:Sodium:neurotransmitter symporter n=1 Tax=Ruminiclostridium cellulolyticum (strain ATCC 35319 / DSM 5812 / JCM 6584 / H10) TaxID=394503 RepID=B8I661_RUMCH|nr:sodium-dependent transporter [Ruminiclostridium cellulolyticum]ACL76826.1 sodium:neurotransmitter symporter [Ruminiclostridium cellulolyticum H10]